MNSNELHATPTVADEVSAVVDDAHVISKTLPSVQRPADAWRLMGQVNHAVEVTRGYVIEQPVQAVLIAAAGGAALTALLLSLMRGDRI